MRCEPSLPDRELTTTRTLKVGGNSMTFPKHSISLPQAGALAAPCGAAIWAVTVVEGTTALTTAGCAALTAEGLGGAAAGAQFGNALNMASVNSNPKKE